MGNEKEGDKKDENPSKKPPEQTTDELPPPLKYVRESYDSEADTKKDKHE